MISKKLDDLLLPMRSRMIMFIAGCSQRGVDIVVICTRRDHEAQAALYACGRTLPGPVKTNAKPNSSMHEFGLAVDFVPVKDGKAEWEVFSSGDLSKDWEIVKEEAEKAGLEWAGNWKTFKEYDHVQYTGGLTLAQIQNGEIPV